MRQIPVPVLYGVFLYMGIASLSGNQFFERILLLGMQPSLYPAQPHTDRETVSRLVRGMGRGRGRVRAIALPRPAAHQPRDGEPPG